MDATAIALPEGHVSLEWDFATLYQARFSDLAAQLYAFTGDALETQDLVQEAFIRAWQRWDRIGRYDDPGAWVRRAAWNLAITRHKRLKIFRRVPEHDPPPASGPESGPEAGLNRMDLVASLRKLPEQIRRAVVLHYLADMPIADIAAEMRAAEGTIKSWLRRGRAELAIHLAGYRDGGR
ncbi:MAG TPA: SigE family RNA polymerase sigma factor [Candidatus Limnocylindrales bacterium]|nr:SigE family RNA polymerase sigma factor [Candidatus Limnocylindrales bacterium]